MHKPQQNQKVATSKRESLKLNASDWFWLKEVAADTGSLYSGKASWRRLMARIARGELVVSVARPVPIPAPAPAPVIVALPPALTAFQEQQKKDIFNEIFAKI